MSIKKYFKKRIRGWFPQEPLLTFNSKKQKSNNENELSKKYFRYALIADAVVLQAFLGVNFVLVNPAYRDSFYFVVWWLGFILTLISVNLLLYLRFRWNTNQQER